MIIDIGMLVLSLGLILLSCVLGGVNSLDASSMKANPFRPSPDLLVAVLQAAA